MLADVKFTQRLSAALDAYEECVILTDLYKRIQDAFGWASKRSGPWPEEFYAWLPNSGWYIEVSWPRREEARTAANQAIEHYRQHFWAAAQLQPALKECLLALGLPQPGDISDITRRPGLAYEARWKQIWRGYHTSNQRYLDKLPEDTEHLALNVPDPFVAVHVQRAYGAHLLAGSKRLGVAE